MPTGVFVRPNSSLFKKGHLVSEEVRLKMSLAHKGIPELPHNIGRIDIDREYAKGMNEEEARNKIMRSEMRSGYYKRLFDFELQSISAWNNNTLWRIDSEKSKYRYDKERRSYVSK